MTGENREGFLALVTTKATSLIVVALSVVKGVYYGCESSWTWICIIFFSSVPIGHSILCTGYYSSWGTYYTYMGRWKIIRTNDFFVKNVTRPWCDEKRGGLCNHLFCPLNKICCIFICNGDCLETKSLFVFCCFKARFFLDIKGSTSYNLNQDFKKVWMFVLLKVFPWKFDFLRSLLFFFSLSRRVFKSVDGEIDSHSKVLWIVTVFNGRDPFPEAHELLSLCSTMTSSRWNPVQTIVKSCHTIWCVSGTATFERMRGDATSTWESCHVCRHNIWYLQPALHLKNVIVCFVQGILSDKDCSSKQKKNAIVFINQAQ